MPSVLFDSKADIISYGMGELQTIEMAKRLSEGYPVEALYDIRGICYAVKTSDYVPKPLWNCRVTKEFVRAKGLCNCCQKRARRGRCGKRQNSYSAPRQLYFNSESAYAAA